MTTIATNISKIGNSRMKRIDHAICIDNYKYGPKLVKEHDRWVNDEVTRKTQNIDILIKHNDIRSKNHTSHL